MFVPFLWDLRPFVPSVLHFGLTVPVSCKQVNWGQCVAVVQLSSSTHIHVLSSQTKRLATSKVQVSPVSLFLKPWATLHFNGPLGLLCLRHSTLYRHTLWVTTLFGQRSVRLKLTVWTGCSLFDYVMCERHRDHDSGRKQIVWDWDIHRRVNVLQHWR